MAHRKIVTNVRESLGSSLQYSSTTRKMCYLGTYGDGSNYHFGIVA
ncbi:hypothetical protein MKY19_01910 [Paenibacillus sp. FSL R5-0744]